MADPLVIQTIKRFKRELLAHEFTTTRAMANEWIKIEDRLRSEIELLSREIADMRAAGKIINVTRLWEVDRYRNLLVQLDFEMARYVPIASQAIIVGETQTARLGVQAAQQSIIASYMGAGQIAADFNMLPIDAVQGMVGMLANGAPLATLLRDAYGTAAQGFTQQLINGTALGWNPRKTAKMAMQGMASGLGRATTIARTEQIRVFREANRQQMDESGVVEGYVRLVAHSGRTCMACLAAEGEWYSTKEELRDHPNGRCTAVPKVDGLPLPKFERGVDWFSGRTPKQQRQQMGAAKWQAWQDGKFDFEQLSVITRDSTWGNGVRPASLAELGIG